MSSGATGSIGPYYWTGGTHGTSGFSGYHGTGGHSWSSIVQDEKPTSIPVLSSRMRKIKLKEEKKAEPEWIEVSTVFEMALRIAKNSFYGILGIKVKGTKPPAVSGKIKKIKEGRDEN